MQCIAHGKIKFIRQWLQEITEKIHLRIRIRYSKNTINLSHLCVGAPDQGRRSWSGIPRIP